MHLGLKKIQKYLVILLFALLSANNFARIPNPVNQDLYDRYKWSAMYYYGITGTDGLTQMLQGQFHRWPEHVQTLGFLYTLDKNNIVRRFFNPIVGVVQIGADFSIRVGSMQSTIYEVDPYIGFRWANFPWNKYLVTSLAIGEGVSFPSAVPAVEIKDNENTKRILNYLMLEATFALPSHPRIQLLARIQHRSGAYGLYQAGNTGSNVVGLGLRYLFD